jgi:hypothetical protein
MATDAGTSFTPRLAPTIDSTPSGNGIESYPGEEFGGSEVGSRETDECREVI